MEFTQDWTQHLQGNVRCFLGGYRDRKCSLLEVGIFEGRSAKIFLEEVLTHPESTYTGIDDWWSHLTQGYPPERTNELQGKRKDTLAWLNSTYRNAMENFSKFPADKCRIIEDLTHSALYNLHQERATFDIVYIDGDHSFGQCFLDSVLAWPLVKEVMLWDDAAPGWPATVAMSHFLNSIPNQYDVLFWPSRHPENFQLGITKREWVGHKFVEPVEFLMDNF